MSSPFYRTPEWRALRAACLSRQPTCATPGCRARAVVADHIIPRSKGGADCLSNLRGLCAQCHNQRRQGGEPKAWTAASGQPMDPRHWWNQPRAGNLSGLGGGTVGGEPDTVSSDPALSRGDG